MNIYIIIGIIIIVCIIILLLINKHKKQENFHESKTYPNCELQPMNYTGKCYDNSLYFNNKINNPLISCAKSSFGCGFPLGTFNPDVLYK